MVICNLKSQVFFKSYRTSQKLYENIVRHKFEISTSILFNSLKIIFIAAGFVGWDMKSALGRRKFQRKIFRHDGNFSIMIKIL